MERAADWGSDEDPLTRVWRSHSASVSRCEKKADLGVGLFLSRIMRDYFFTASFAGSAAGAAAAAAAASLAGSAAFGASAVGAGAGAGAGAAAGAGAGAGAAGFCSLQAVTARAMAAARINDLFMMFQPYGKSNEWV